MDVAQHFTFSGQLNISSFTDFARHRAARLALVLDMGAIRNEAVEMSVTGDPNLIDMFEMAMSLGPHDCIVLDIERHEGGM